MRSQPNPETVISRDRSSSRLVFSYHINLVPRFSPTRESARLGTSIKKSVRLLRFWSFFCRSSFTFVKQCFNNRFQTSAHFPSLHLGSKMNEHGSESAIIIIIIIMFIIIIIITIPTIFICIAPFLLNNRWHLQQKLL